MSFDLKITNGDLEIANTGDFQKVIDTDKLIQDILKCVTTQVGSNVFHPWYGCQVTRSLIGNVLDMQFTTTVASGQLRVALESIQKLQKGQAAYQVVSPYEQLAVIQEVLVDRNIIDPRFFTITIRVLTNALTQAETQFNVRPGL